MWVLRVDGPSWAVEFGDDGPADAGAVLGATQAAIAQGLPDGIYRLEATTLGGVVATWREPLPTTDTPPAATVYVAEEVAPGETVVNPETDVQDEILPGPPDPVDGE